MIDSMRADIEFLKSNHVTRSQWRLLMALSIISTIIGLLVKIPAFFHSIPVAPSTPPTPSASPTTNTAEGGSVRIGLARPGEDSQKTYLTTREVADKEGVSQRTVNAWIQASRIEPKPVQSDRAWQIAVDYRILPLTADSQP